MQPLPEQVSIEFHGLGKKFHLHTCISGDTSWYQVVRQPYMMPPMVRRPSFHMCSSRIPILIRIERFQATVTFPLRMLPCEMSLPYRHSYAIPFFLSYRRNMCLTRVHSLFLVADATSSNIVRAVLYVISVLTFEANDGQVMSSYKSNFSCSMNI